MKHEPRNPHCTCETCRFYTSTKGFSVLFALSLVLVACASEGQEATKTPEPMNACPDGAEPWDDMNAWETAASLIDVDSAHPPVLVKRDSDWPFADYEAGMWAGAPCTFEGSITRAVWLHMPYAEAQPTREHEALHELLFRRDGDWDENHTLAVWDELDAITL